MKRRHLEYFMTSLLWKTDSRRFGVLVSVLLCFLTACSTGSSSSGISSHTPLSATHVLSPTPLPPGTVLFQADWSQGLAGWTAQGWAREPRQGISDTGGTAQLTIPFHPAENDYAVEIRLQIVSSVAPYGGYFEMLAPASTGRDGYQATIADLKGPGPRQFGDHPMASVVLDPSGDMNRGSGMPQDYEPGSGWHLYRLEVRGNEARLLDNGTQIGLASSQQTGVLSSGPIQFICSLVILRVSSLRVLTL